VRFSLIIPSYNNAQELMRELPPLLDYLRSRSVEAEVIVVNDGSARVEELQRFCDSNAIRLVQHQKNLGKGAAVRTGMLAARE
jgi:glycosyltransferase involved in cell wall biosynthesis